jgi:hypothetical protein
MTEYRRPHDTRNERDDSYPYGSDRYVRHEPSTNGIYGDHLDDRGARWESTAEDRPGEHDDHPSWETRERGGYWRLFENRRPSFAGRGPKGYRRPDDRIREDVCDRMTDDPMLDASEVSVEVRGGEVMLTGWVTSRDQNRRAEDIVHIVSGVKDVTNQLRVMRGGVVHNGRETTSSQPAHEVGRGTPRKSTASTTT